MEAQHTVILGFNAHTVPLLEQFAFAKERRRKRGARASAAGVREPIVILAERPAREMEEIIQASGLGQKLKVIVREGEPFDQERLAKVAAQDARHVMLFHDHFAAASEEGKKAATLLGLGNLRSSAVRRKFKQTLLVQNPALDAQRAAADGGDGDGSLVSYAAASLAKTRGADDRLEILQGAGQAWVGSVLGQAVHIPGLSELYEDLLLHGAGASDANIEVEPAAAYPELVGRTFAEAGRLLDGAALLGLVGADGAAELLPRPGGAPLTGDDSLILVHSGAVRVRPARGPEPAPPGEGAVEIRDELLAKQAPRHVVVLNWTAEGAGGTSSRFLQSFADSLQKGAAAGTRVTAVNTAWSPQVPTGRQGAVEYEQLVEPGPVIGAATLRAAGVGATADVVVVLSGPAAGAPGTTAIADSKALAALLACRQALEGADETKRPRLVAALSSDTAQQTA